MVCCWSCYYRIIPSWQSRRPLQKTIVLGVRDKVENPTVVPVPIEEIFDLLGPPTTTHRLDHNNQRPPIYLDGGPVGGHQHKQPPGVL